MKIIQRKISELKPSEYNPRKITDKELEDLKTSIKKFGIQEPAIININPDRKNIIISGHQRIKAAKSMGKKAFPCVELDLDVEKEKELNLRMNRNTGNFDFELLNEFFEKDFLLDVGFEDWEIEFGSEEIGREEISEDSINNVTFVTQIMQVRNRFAKNIESEKDISQIDAFLSAESLIIELLSRHEYNTD